MNKEKYSDPTAEQAIGHVMLEQKLKKKRKKAVKPDEHTCANESRLQGSRQKP